MEPADDPQFVDACAGRLVLAINAVKMPDPLRSAMLGAVEQARTETRHLSVPDRPRQFWEEPGYLDKLGQ